MMRLIFIPLLALSLCFAGCKDKKATVDSDHTSPAETVVPIQVIHYKKTPCFGVCPQFEMVVMSDGKASYKGERNVDMVGVWTGEWSSKQIDRVMKAALEIGYFQLDDTYDNRLVTDLPATYTTLHLDGTDKTIMNRYQGPKELQQVYTKLDEIIGEVKWSKLEDN